jgi:hypothetical protein
MLPLTRSRSRARFFGIPFSPSSLFAAGEQGAWYDPSDYSTLFTDSAGTTPVSAPGNGSDVFVGLMLDKSKGLVLGPELVTNGSGSSTTGWDVGAGLSSLTSVNGEFVATANGGISSFFSRLVTLEVGKWYQCSVTVRSPSSNSVTNLGRLRVEGGITANLAVQVSQEDTNVTLSGYVLATSTSTRIYVSVQTASVWGGSGDVLYASNVSIKAIAGNHAFQTSSAKRPKLAARYNLLTYSEDLSNIAWAKTGGAQITNDGATPPAGVSVLWKFASSSAGSSVPDITQSGVPASGVAHRVRLYARKGNVNTISIWLGSAGADFNLDTGVASGGGSPTIIAAGDGGYWCEATPSPLNAKTDIYFVASAPGQYVYVTAIDARPASQATGLIGPTYQRVAAATVYDTAGFLPYLAFDGLDDSMSTNSIDPGTDKAQVFAGVRKLSDAATAILTELSDAGVTSSGIFNVWSPFSTTVEYAVQSRGSAGSSSAQRLTIDNAAFVSPVTNVLTGVFDIPGDLSSARINGVSQGFATGDQGGGNFNNYPLFIGARNNASSFFNGWMSSLIVRFGPNLSTSQIEATEAWVNGKTGAY